MSKKKKSRRKDTKLQEEILCQKSFCKTSRHPPKEYEGRRGLESFGASEADRAGTGQEDQWGQSHRVEVWSQKKKNEGNALNCVPKINVHMEAQIVTLFGNRVISYYRCN